MMRLAVHWADLHIVTSSRLRPGSPRRTRSPARGRRPLISSVCRRSPRRRRGRTNDSAGAVRPTVSRLLTASPSSCGGRGPVRAGRGVAGADHLADDPRADVGGGDPRRRAGVRAPPAYALPAAPGRGRGAGCGSCPTRCRSPWRTRRTSGTSPSTTSRRRSTGPSTSRLTWRSPTPSHSPKRSPAEHLAKLGSTDTAHGRRATALGDLARHQLTINFYYLQNYYIGDNATTDTGADASLVRQGPLGTSRDRGPGVAQDHLAGARTSTPLDHLSADAITHFDNPDVSDEVLCGRIEQGRPTAAVRGRSGGLRTTQCAGGRHEGHRPPGAVGVPGLPAHTGDAEHVIVRDGTVFVVRPQRQALRPRPRHPCTTTTIPEDGGPTATDNLAPLCRRHHRLKTR